MAPAVLSAFTDHARERREETWRKGSHKYSVPQKWKTPWCAGCGWQSSLSCGTHPQTSPLWSQELFEVGLHSWKCGTGEQKLKLLNLPDFSLFKFKWAHIVRGCHITYNSPRYLFRDFLKLSDNQSPTIHHSWTDQSSEDKIYASPG